MKRTTLINFLLMISFFAASQTRQGLRESAGITASLPWVNNYCYYNYDLKQSSFKTGFTGLGAAAFYKTGNNKFSINVGFTGDLPAPIGAFDYGKNGTRTSIGSAFGELLYHRGVFKKLSVIAGFSYVQYRFNFTSYVSTLPSYAVSDKTLGLTAGSSYRFSNFFSVALLYRPAIISFDLKQYRHLISLDAGFDIHFWRRK